MFSEDSPFPENRDVVQIRRCMKQTSYEAWNPAAEDQCFDRCHRLGQKQDVVITKFIVKNSVEENMLKIQQKKRELAAGAFGTKTPSNEAKINEIKTLMDL